MTVLEICTKQVAVAAPRETVVTAARRMSERGVGTLVVVDELQRPLGIVTDRDLALRCTAQPRDPRRTRLYQVMSSPVVWVRDETPVEAALDEMARLRMRRLAVVDAKNRLVGLVSLDDALCRELGADCLLGRVLRATLHDGTA